MDRIGELHLWLGTQAAANDRDLMNRVGITHIINITPDKDKDVSVPGRNKIKYKHIKVDDVPSTFLLKHFHATNQFIHDALENGGRVLVHCHAGISRSTTILLAYLMWRYQMKYKAALDYVRKFRWYVLPNKGFREQLDIYETELKIGYPLPNGVQ